MRAERRVASSQLRPFLLGPIEGWEQTDGSHAALHFGTYQPFA